MYVFFILASSYCFDNKKLEVSIIEEKHLYFMLDLVYKLSFIVGPVICFLQREIKISPLFHKIRDFMRRWMLQLAFV